MNRSLIFLKHGFFPFEKFGGSGEGRGLIWNHCSRYIAALRWIQNNIINEDMRSRGIGERMSDDRRSWRN